MWFTLISKDRVEKINKIEEAYKLVKEDIFGVGLLVGFFGFGVYVFKNKIH